MTYEINLAGQAIRDLGEIYQFIQAENSAAAQTWFRGLESAIFSLETMPYRGAAAPDNAALRHLLYGNRPHIYRIIYSIDELSAQVNVAQIRHGARHPLRAG